MKPSILVVDDDASVREATSWMLTDAGYRVLEATDGLTALDLLLRGSVDLVITDIGMPRMDGLALVGEVHRRWPGLPVLLVSGRPQPPGTQTFMPKPFTARMLLHAVGQVLQPPPQALSPEA